MLPRTKDWRCKSCQARDVINLPIKSSFVIKTATREIPIPACDDWGDVMDNIPAVREVVDRLLEAIDDCPCECET